MKVLILGGTGFLGKSLAEYLRKVSSFEILTPTRKDLNLLNREICKEYIGFHKPDRIIHCAVNVASVEESLRTYYNIVSNFESFGRLLYFGSGAEYNPLRYVPLMKESYSENSFPETGYALAKWIIGRDIEKSSVENIVNLRLFAVYGNYENFSRRFISNNICRVLAGLPVSMGQDIKFDYLFIDDLCEYILKILTAEKISFKTYNICSGEPVRLSALGQTIRSLMKVKTELKIAKIGEAAEYSGDPSRAIREFGKISKTPVEAAINGMVSYFADQYSNNSDFKRLTLDLFRDEI